MEKLINDFLAQKSFAVAGSFRDESKYAYKILKILKNKGYEAYPVHPTMKEVDGQPCYSSVKDIPYAVDVVNLVTPPSVTEMILGECKQRGIKKIWLQPGAESENAIRFCKENNMDVVYQVCVMMEAK
ncbi:MAG: CoA-binding protein [Candidatus Omnitrophica bacterium]|nr:CoA-binding protein [Candidatus Omnitrophota bacterium]